MPKVVRSSVIDVPVDRLWAVLRDFNGHDQYHPIVRRAPSSAAIRPTRSAAFRKFTLQDGSELREQLLSLSDLEMTYSYCLLDTPIPLFNYVPTSGCSRSPTATAASGAGRAASRRRPAARRSWRRRSAMTSMPPDRGRAQAAGEFRREEHEPCRLTCAAAPPWPRHAGVVAGDRNARVDVGRNHRHARHQRGPDDRGHRPARPRSAFRRIEASGARGRDRRRSTMAAILANRDLAYLHAPARPSEGRPCATWRRSGAICSPKLRMAISP